MNENNSQKTQSQPKYETNKYCVLGESKDFDKLLQTIMVSSNKFGNSTITSGGK